MAIIGVCIGITIEKKNVDELAVSLEYRDLDVVAYDLSSVDLFSYIADNSTNIGNIQGVYDSAKSIINERIFAYYFCLSN